ncbi:DUF6197 family protein [Streptomyces sp. NBC_01198]|uniref:DUF6197 family protein n=1 Tax=Streptomyces sp. NBC_01198 TaxID=2903769 RepID=UPI002E109BC5|nr:hypothetical protein OG702_22750 [Streptomyces sp. NBC_01198]
MTHTTTPPTAAALPRLADVDTLGADLVDQIEAWLTDPARTAHRLVTAPTADLVAEALADLTPTTPTTAAGVILPGGLWRILPDRLLFLHPARRGEGVARLRIPVADHLDLTAAVLEQWGWAQTGTRIRTATGRRCILGAQYTVFRLGYGTHDTATTAGHHINALLRSRGINLPFPQWNDQPHIGREQALAVVRAAATAART